MTKFADTHSRHRLAARAAAVLAALVGGAGVAGWIAGVERLRSFVGDEAAMNVNAAFCFVVCAGALWVLSGLPSRKAAVVARVAAAGVALFAFATLSQYVIGLDLGLGALVGRESLGVVDADSNGTPAAAAVAFLLVGAALAGLDVRVGGRWSPAPLAAGIVAALALVTIVSYRGSRADLTGLSELAVPVTLGVLFLSLGVLLARPDVEPMRLVARDTRGGAMLRRLLPLVLVVPLLLAELGLDGERLNLFGPQTATWLLAGGIVALGLPLIWIVGREIDGADEHRRHARALHVSEERTRRIVETAHDAIVSTDSAGRIATWNASAQRMFGWTPEEAIGRDAATTLLPGGLSERTCNDVSLGEHRALETTVRHRDGREVPVEISLTMVRESEGWVFNAFLRDITERRRAHERLDDAQHEVLHRLARVAEYRDDDTGEHTKRVAELSARLAARIGLPEREIDLLLRAAPLHDVGKVGIPDAILLKPSQLTAAEFEVIKSHAAMGAQMLAGRGFPLLEMAERIALTHHERWDGSGYPAGLAGEEIPLVGRIVALADVFDALTHDRPYKSAWPLKDAVAEVRAQRGRQFDPALVDAFLELVGAADRPTFATQRSAGVALSLSIAPGIVSSMRLTIAAKFLAVLAVVGPLIVLVAVGGVTGVRAMKAGSDAVFDDNIQVSQVVTGVGNNLARAQAIADQLALAPGTVRRERLNAQLDADVIPRVERGLAELIRLHANDAAAERTPVSGLELDWRRFLALRHDALLPQEGQRPTVASATRLTQATALVLDPMIATVSRLDLVETAHAREADRRVDRRYKASLHLILGSAAAALLLGLGSVIMLIGNVVPRIRQYSRFARRVSAGDLSARLHPRGHDDLAQLGRALQTMVERRAATAAQEDHHAEFVASMQLAETEEEAHDLLKRHVERSARGSSVVVLNRNNSADRLEARTALPEDSLLQEPLATAKPGVPPVSWTPER